MPFSIETTDGGLNLQLTGAITVRDAQELGRCLAAALPTGGTATVETSTLEDIDTGVLQILVSLRKTATDFRVPQPSEAFVSAVDRCALRCELLAGRKENS